MIVDARSGSGSVVGSEALGLFAEASEQASDGARAQLQVVCDGGGGLAVVGPQQDGVAQWQGGSSRHGGPRTSSQGMIHPTLPISADKPLCRY